jgi:hypothetical protein
MEDLLSSAYTWRDISFPHFWRSLTETPRSFSNGIHILSTNTQCSIKMKGQSHMAMMVSRNASPYFVVCLIILNLFVQSTNAFVTPPNNRANALTFCSSTTVHKRPTASILPTALSAFDSHGGVTNSGSLMLGLDLNSRVSDDVRNVVIGIVVIMVLVSALSVFVTQSVLPEQMNNLALMVKAEYPERWQELESKLNEGERIRDRLDLMTELTEIGVSIMKEESEQEMKQLVIMINESKKEGGEDTDSLREPIEATLGCSIEDFVSKAETNSDSRNLSDDRKELSELLKAEFVNKDD